MQISRLSSFRKIIYVTVAFIMGITIVAGVVVLMGFGIKDRYEDCLIFFPAIIGMVFAMILYVGCSHNNRENRKLENIFASVTAFIFAILLISGITDLLEGHPEARNYQFAINTIAYFLSVLIHILLWQYQCASIPKSPKRKYFTYTIAVLSVIYLSFVVINIFYPVLFTVNEQGIIVYTGLILDLAFTVAFYLVFFMYVLTQRCSWAKKISIASFSVFPIFYMIITLVWFLLDINIMIYSFGYIFMLFALYVVFFGDYSIMQEKFIEQKAELAELKTDLMLSKINPHFIANTLNSIVALCRFDPPEAERATKLFAGYLRENYVDMTGEQIIPFKKELNNLKNYISIEQIRFPGLVAEYDIEVSDFMIPAMIIQPLVENAIKHGIRNRNDGLIKLSVSESNDAYIVSVADNGVGFKETDDDGNTHIGINNCRSRLSMLCGGTLTINQRDCGGTVCEIRIPKGEVNN